MSQGCNAVGLIAENTTLRAVIASLLVAMRTHKVTVSLDPQLGIKVQKMPSGGIEVTLKE